MKWGPFLRKGGGIIEVDIGGHPHIPLGHLTMFPFSFLNSSTTFYF